MGLSFHCTSTYSPFGCRYGNVVFITPRIELDKTTPFSFVYFAFSVSWKRLYIYVGHIYMYMYAAISYKVARAHNFLSNLWLLHPITYDAFTITWFSLYIFLFFVFSLPHFQGIDFVCPLFVTLHNTPVCRARIHTTSTQFSTQADAFSGGITWELFIVFIKKSIKGFRRLVDFFFKDEIYVKTTAAFIRVTGDQKFIWHLTADLV